MNLFLEDFYNVLDVILPPKHFDNKRASKKSLPSQSNICAMFRIILIVGQGFPRHRVTLGKLVNLSFSFCMVILFIPSFFWLFFLSN